MRSQDEVLSCLKKWFNEDPNVRAAILTNSRANPGVKTDFLSDYDIELFVESCDPFKKNDRWLLNFGEPMVSWPYRPGPTFDDKWITRLVLFDDGIRIDFQVTKKVNNCPLFTDYGFEILVDKDSILTEIPKPTFTQYNTRKPTENEFEILINDFWWNTIYVPKHLWRDELPFAKSMMFNIHSNFLNSIIDWYIGLEHEWRVNTGIGGRYFKKYLSHDIWTEYEATFSDADIDNCWKSFDITIDLFSKLAKRLGKALDYDYSEETEHKMRTYYNYIRHKKKE